MNHLMLDRFHYYLRGIGQSRTMARDRVFLALYRLGRCRAADVRQALGDAPLERTTLYRTLRFLREIDALHEFPNGMIELNDRFKQHHHHFTCVMCGHEISFHDDKLERAIERIAVGRQLKLEGHQIELTGLCLMCQSQATATT